MNNTLLVLAVSLALAGCGNSIMADKPATHDSKSVESLLTVKDMNDCEQSQGVTPPKTAADAYVLPAESLDKVRACALGMEKKRMPLLADLIDKYDLMLRQGNKECGKDIGTHYGDVCMRRSQKDAAEWYDLAVSQRLRSELPSQTFGQAFGQTLEKDQVKKPD